MKVYHKCSVFHHLNHNMTEDNYEIFASTKEGSVALFGGDRDLVIVYEIDESQVICHSSGDTGDGKVSPKNYGYDEVICNVSPENIVELIFNCEGDIEDYLYEVVAADDSDFADLLSRLYEDFFGTNIELSKTKNCGLSADFLNF